MIQMSVNPITKVVPRQNPALDKFLHHCHAKKYAARSTMAQRIYDSQVAYLKQLGLLD